jgi:lipopolysaccharide transport system permease protein
MTREESVKSPISQTMDAAICDREVFSSRLTENPLIKIRASRPFSTVSFRELWAHRDLLYFLIWRDLKARYKQTILGVSWAVVQPFLMTVVFVVFLGKLVRVATGDVPYALFVYAGLLPWTFFSSAVSTGSYSLVANGNMLTKVYFPRLILPAAAVGVRLSDFLLASLVLIVLIPYYGVSFGWRLVALPFLTIALAALILGLAGLFSALHVRYRDTGTALPVLLQLWMFCSPIVYPVTLVPEKWRWAYELNPMVGIVEGFRSALLGLPFDQRSLALSAATTIIVLICATFVFHRMEDDFADIV